MVTQTSNMMEDDVMIHEERRDGSRSALMGFLLVPLLFLGGWLANDIFTPDTTDQQRFGVGAGPGDLPMISPTTQPVVQPTWSTGVIPSVTPMMQDDTTTSSNLE